MNRDLAVSLCRAQASCDRHAEAVALPAVVEALNQRPRVNQYTSGTLVERFWSKIAWGASDCWYWWAARDAGGYGIMSRNGLKRAHRVSWELHRGPIPTGMKVLHHCDVRNCVNPDHLFLGTQADNVADMVAKGRAKGAPHHGAKNPMAVFSEAQVRAIRTDFDSGRATMRELAKQHGVAVMTIFRIVRRQTWTQLL